MRARRLLIGVGLLIGIGAILALTDHRIRVISQANRDLSSAFRTYNMDPQPYRKALARGADPNRRFIPGYEPDVPAAYWDTLLSIFRQKHAKQAGTLPLWMAV